jgi:hypothetical protein
MTINDIHSYTLFANVDKRNGVIEGHMVILRKDQMEAIEDIVLAYVDDRLTVQLKEEPTYTLGD